ncbi:hypothetical protein OG426_45265 [Streptomyces canus]|nr:hypothetical protein [Streptomyces canus]MCX4855490.1 hypothetical protein [Streptomyces canus]WSW39133.1 hypothetical protein OG426_45265 [Streptomyces canus]
MTDDVLFLSGPQVTAPATPDSSDLAWRPTPRNREREDAAAAKGESR